METAMVRPHLEQGQVLCQYQQYQQTAGDIYDGQVLFDCLCAGRRGFLQLLFLGGLSRHNESPIYHSIKKYKKLLQILRLPAFQRLLLQRMQLGMGNNAKRRLSEFLFL